jgi:hypothetical protein
VQTVQMIALMLAHPRPDTLPVSSYDLFVDETVGLSASVL